MAKAETQSKRKTLKVRYEGFHRYWTGVSTLATLTMMVGSAASGSGLFTIIFRGLAVILILGVIGRIIIKSWASWEEMKRGEG